MSKYINGKKLEQDDLVLKEAGAYIRKERDGLQVHYDKEPSRLHFFKQILESSWE